MASLLMDPLGYRRLVLDDGWTADEYADWVARLTRDAVASPVPGTIQVNHHVDGRTRPRGISLADQDEAQLGGPASALVRQKREHIKLDHLRDELRATSGAEQDRVLDQHRPAGVPARVRRGVGPVARHTTRAPDGEALTQQVEREHQEVNELVTRLDGELLDPAEHAAAGPAGHGAARGRPR